MKKMFLCLTAIFFVNNAVFSESQWRQKTTIGNKNFNITGDRPVSDTELKFYLYVTVAVLLGKVAYDVSWHSKYSDQVNLYYNNLVDYINHYNISSLKDLSFSCMNDYLYYELWLNNAYCSWLKPWNWTKSQKDAYEKVQILLMFTIHNPILFLNEEEIKEKIADHARTCCHYVSEYPLIYYGELIDRQWDLLQVGGLSKTLNMNMGFMYTELKLNPGLSRLKYILRSNKEYINECHTKKLHDLTKEVARSY